MDRAGGFSWFLAFGLTQCIEVPIYKKGLNAKSWEAFLASALTHPIVWFIIPGLWRYLYLTVIQWDGRLRLSPGMYGLGYGVVAEGFAVFAEAIYFRAMGKPNAFRWALFANAASALTGLLLHWIFGWP